MQHYRFVDWEKDWEDLVLLVSEYEKDAVRELVETYLKTCKRFTSWVALDGERIVGSICIAVHRHAFRGDRVATKVAIYVRPEYKGTGRKLISIAKDYARAQGCTHLYIDREPIKCVLNFS